MQKKYQICTNRPLLIPRTKAEMAEIAKLGDVGNRSRDSYHILYQIKALRDIQTSNGVVPKGTYGGFVESCINLDTQDGSWITPDVAVYQYARITQNSYIEGNCFIHGLFLPLEPITWFLDLDDELHCTHNLIVSKKQGTLMERAQSISREDFDAFVQFQTDNFTVDSISSVCGMDLGDDIAK